MDDDTPTKSLSDLTLQEYSTQTTLNSEICSSEDTSASSADLVRAAALAAASGIPLIHPKSSFPRSKSSSYSSASVNFRSSLSFHREKAGSKSSETTGGMVGMETHQNCRKSEKLTMQDYESALEEERKRTARRFSVSTLWTMASEQDMEVEDSLTKEQQKLKDLKHKISSQSKRNFLLERDVRYLDSRIALLIQNRMALDEDMLINEENSTDCIDASVFPDGKRKQLYGNLFFLLQTEPRIVSHLVQLITLAEIDTLLQTVMFTLYGNQYDSREEHLLLTMFQSVLKSQFDATTDFGLLLRANTPVSRMMTTYTRRGPGQQYLKYVLTENINKVIADENLNLEINPVKIYEQIFNQIEVETGETPKIPRSVSADEALENALVKEIFQPRVEKLISLAQMFLDTIIESLDQVPYGIRWICKQIKELTKKKFPDATEWSICSLIGGFFLLRFVNPAIVTPQSYMITEGQPSKNPRRSLTLLAKMLQNLANKPSYAKEAYMVHLNPFIEQNKERICNFFDNLCDVSDFYESVELEQYMALSKKDITINITLNEIYNTHTLLHQHLNTICSSMIVPRQSSSLSAEKKSFVTSCSHLSSILADLGLPPSQLSRSDNRTLNLALFSRWETTPILYPNMALDGRVPTGSSRDSRELTEADILYMDTKATLVQIMRKQALLVESCYTNHIYVPPITIDHVPEYRIDLIDVNEILDKASNQCKEPTLVKRSLRARQNLRILEDRYRHPLIKRSDLYENFAAEVHAEFHHLNALKTKVMKEIKSLELVYKTICDHNQYMRGQLETYRAYLQNVRIQASGGGNNNDLASGKKTNTLKKSSGKKILGGSGYKKETGPIKFTHSQLEKDGIIVMSAVPENRRNNVFFSLVSPTPGTFMIGLYYKGREKPIVEVDIKLDDLLEKQHDNIQFLDLEYVQLNVNKTLHVLNKYFMKR